MARSIFITGKILSELPTGNWYFAVTCKGCGNRIALLQDTRRGRSPFDAGEVPLKTVCPHCGAKDHAYRSAEVHSFQRPSGKPKTFVVGRRTLKRKRNGQ